MNNVVDLYNKIDTYALNKWLDDKYKYFILEAKEDWKIIKNVCKDDKLVFKITNRKTEWKYYLYKIDKNEFWLVKINKLNKNINFDIIWVLIKIIRDL